MVKIKICGITNEKDAFYSATLGADFLGFNFYNKSPRKISVKLAGEIRAKLPAGVESVGIFVNEEINKIIETVQKCNLKFVQLHGKETPEYCQHLKSGLEIKIIKAIKVKSEGSIRYLSQFKETADCFLLDTYVEGLKGGTGQTFNWNIAMETKKYNKPIFLSGGLNPDNVIDAIKKVQPFAVDVASGVERLPRRKDFDKLKQFITNVKSIHSFT